MTHPSTCTTRQAAITLGISIGTVQAWVEAGRLKAWKTPGGHRRIFIESVDTVLAARGNWGRSFDILVVVESQDEAQGLCSTLVKALADATVRLAFSGEDALLKIGERRPDLLLIDLAIPGLDGFQLLAALRGLPAARPRQVVALSGLSSRELELRGGLPAGIPIFRKPVAPGALADLVAAYRDAWTLSQRTSR